MKRPKVNTCGAGRGVGAELGARPGLLGHDIEFNTPGMVPDRNRLIYHYPTQTLRRTGRLTAGKIFLGGVGGGCGVQARIERGQICSSATAGLYALSGGC
jgi:hypothetical protein